MSILKEIPTAQAAGMNRAKPYQLVLFPMNNGATNVYYILTMNFIAYYANGVLGLALMFATTMVTVMRLFDAVTDPIIGALIDRTNSKFGKFRPYMVIGNVIIIVSSIYQPTEADFIHISRIMTIFGVRQTNRASQSLISGVPHTVWDIQDLRLKRMK